MQNRLPDMETTGDRVVYSSKFTRIIRRKTFLGTLILKQALSPEAVARLRQEAAMLQRLAGIDGLPRIASEEPVTDTLVLRDDGGMPLAQVLQGRRLLPQEMLDLALQLARLVAAVHRRRVVHKDINPSNILLGPDQCPLLIDFNIAGLFAEDRPAFTHQSDIAGTLAYMAPEQTGRTGRVVDHRADLYSLGVVFYEMAAGRRPFESENPLDLIRDQLVRAPQPPVELNPELPPALSEIILRLLEKDAERRYQSADGLADDLVQLQQALARGDRTPFPLGYRDFPLRLSPPSRLIGRGRDAEILCRTLDQAVSGSCRALLVTGSAGVGKSALVNELRPMVTERRGWFVSGKFDSYSKDAPSATIQALRALGRLLLAEPEAELAAHRERILKALGPNLGFFGGALPEFVVLLGDPPRPDFRDPAEAEARVLQACIDVLRCIASPERPLVMVLDDLHQAAEITARFIHAVLTASAPLPGFLLVGAGRDSEMPETHPLRSRLAQWEKLGVAPAQLPLSSLSAAGLNALVGEMLRLPPAEAAPLSDTLRERTGGNPNDTVELINALRYDGLLTPREGGWAWDASDIRRYVGKCEVIDLLARRIERLPVSTQNLLGLMACLSGEVKLSLLAAASGQPQSDLEVQLAAALDDGLVTMEQGSDSILGFRHDRVQQAALDRLQRAAQRRLHLDIARRLARLPEFSVFAAEQYLAAIDEVTDIEERRQVLPLLQHAAMRARVINNAAAERYLAAAIRLLKETAGAADAAKLMEMETQRHDVLVGLTRFAEADALYQSIVQGCGDPLQTIEMTGVQLSSLCARGRMPEALQVGLALMGQLGVETPRDLQAAIGMGLTRLGRWLGSVERAGDLRRPEVQDPRVLDLARLIKKVQTPAFFLNPPLHAWLTLESHRLWIEHGPCAALAACLSTLPLLMMRVLGNCAGAYASGRHMIAVGDARGYEPATSMVRFNLAICAQHWFEPIEAVIAELQHAREILIKAGEVSYASFAYSLEVALQLDSAPVLDAASSLTEAALSYMERAGETQTRSPALSFRQFVRALRGETAAPGSFSDGAFDEAQHEASVDADPTQAVGASMFHITRAMAAMAFGDAPGVTRHTAVALAQRASTPGFYFVTLAQTLQAITAADKARVTPAGERAGLLAEIDACHEWLAQRAADVPVNFLHLQHLMEAERAWTTGDNWAAAAAFDAALREVAGRSRPWQHGLIAERAGSFHLGRGLEHIGRKLLAEARGAYERWGATAKVQDMLCKHPFLRSTAGTAREEAGAGHEQTVPRSTVMSSYSVDMLAVLRASQALSSETSVERINARVAELLGTMTGATSVLLVVRRDDRQGWFLSASTESTEAVISVEEAAEHGLLPLSAFRYAERTREQLVVADATDDDRFARDPYLNGVGQCSLLLIPILSNGDLRAVLMLENRISRGAFSGEGLDAVTLIAGQLSASLDNALLYASLERKVAERTVALEEANRQLEQLSITDALTGLANRRRFNEVLETEWRRARHAGEAVGLALIDIDHFKLYNDHYGHQGGDACLRLVSAAMKAALRAGPELLARYGGEEFVLILPGTALAGAASVGERLRAAVAGLDEPHLKSGHGIVTVSIGAASLVAAPDITAERLIELADAALYAAKREGRNRVSSAPG